MGGVDGGHAVVRQLGQPREEVVEVLAHVRVRAVPGRRRDEGDEGVRKVWLIQEMTGHATHQMVRPGICA